MGEELKEITRLCGVIKEKDKEIERLNNIIKEVREHFKELIKYYNGEIGEETTYLYIHIGMINDVLEILDKGSDKE